MPQRVYRGEEIEQHHYEKRMQRYEITGKGRELLWNNEKGDVVEDNYLLPGVASFTELS
jgi:hypothetical protein